MNQELLKKARAAKTPEEIKDIMVSNGIEGFSDETAKKYFDYLNRGSGELSDDELEQAAGGCNTYGHPTVTCDKKCNCGKFELSYRLGKRMRNDYSTLRNMWEMMTIGSQSSTAADVYDKCGYCLHLGFNSSGTGFCEVQ